jgi:hypothetical protein
MRAETSASRKGADYRNRRRPASREEIVGHRTFAGLSGAIPCAINASDFAGDDTAWIPRENEIRFLSDDVRGQLVLEEGDAVAQAEPAFLQALDLDRIGPRDSLQGFDCSIEIPMLLAQPLELCLQLDIFIIGHSQPPNSPRADAAPGTPAPLRSSAPLYTTTCREMLLIAGRLIGRL